MGKEGRREELVTDWIVRRTANAQGTIRVERRAPSLRNMAYFA